MAFLPEKYEAPKKPSNYMKFVEGENVFRILSDMIVGWEYWVGDKGDRKPVRVHTFDELPESEQSLYEDSDSQDKPRHFWAFLVWNYAMERAQILEVTQSSIQKKIENLCKSPRWGDPVKKYDLIVTKSKIGDRVTYDTQPAPPVPLDLNGKTIPAVNLRALYEGEDPFKGVEDSDEPAIKTIDIDIDEVLK